MTIALLKFKVESLKLKCGWLFLATNFFTLHFSLLTSLPSVPLGEGRRVATEGVQILLKFA